jgi:hypothetical protein
MPVKETVQIDVQVESKNTLGSLEKQLAKINDELKETEIGSKAFKTLSKEAQILERNIESVNNEIKGITLEAKIKAGQNAVLGLSGALEATVGTLGLLGIESETFGKFEEKAISALTAARGFIDMSEGFGNLAVDLKKMNVAQKAYNLAAAAGNKIMKALNITMKLNPIGVLVTTLVIAGGLIFAFRDKIKDLIKSALGPFKGIVDKISDAFVKLGEAIGVTDTKAVKDLKARIKLEEQAIKEAAARGESTLQMEKNLLVKKAELLEKGTKEYEENLNEQKILDIKIKKEQEESDKKASDKKIENAKKTAEKLKQQEQTYLRSLQKINDEIIDMTAKSEEEQLKIKFDRRNRDIDNLEITEEKKTELKLKNQELYNEQYNELLDKQAEDNKKKQKERALANQELDFEIRELEVQNLEDQLSLDTDRVNAEFDKRRDSAAETGEDLFRIETLRLKTLNNLNSQYVKDTKNQEDTLADYKASVQNATIDNIQGALGTLFEDNKAIASANVLVDAAQAGVGIIKAGQELGGLASIPYQVSQFALLAATTFKSLQAINSASPSGGGAPSTPAPGGVTQDLGRVENIDLGAPTNTVEPTNAVRAYVLTGDINSAQEATSRLSNRRSLG